MTENNGQTTAELAPAEDSGEDVPLETWVKDVDLQIRRLRSKATQAAGDGDARPAVADVLNELHANILPLLKDLGAYVERLEDHAEWASEELGNLSDAVQGTDENASQLAPVDAERLKVFLLSVAHGADEMLTRPEGAPAEGSADHTRLQEWSREAVKLVGVIEDITIDTSDESSSDDQTTGDDSVAATEGGQAEA